MPTSSRSASRSHQPSLSRHGVRSSKGSSRKKFDRPELTSGWHKFTHNTFVRIVAAIVLVGGTGTLTWAAVTMNG